MASITSLALLSDFEAGEILSACASKVSHNEHVLLCRVCMVLIQCKTH
jgi:hypothetical protein